ncbi:hypothetical protein HGRIS_011041 [Hohenbuehelia grisea]
MPFDNARNFSIHDSSFYFVQGSQTVHNYDTAGHPYSFKQYQARNIPEARARLKDDPTFCIIDIQRILVEWNHKSSLARDLKIQLDALQRALKLGELGALLVVDTPLGTSVVDFIDSLIYECSQDLILLRKEIRTRSHRRTALNQILSALNRREAMDDWLVELRHKVKEVSEGLYQILAAMTSPVFRHLAETSAIQAPIIKKFDEEMKGFVPSLGHIGFPKFKVVHPHGEVHIALAFCMSMDALLWITGVVFNDVMMGVGYGCEVIHRQTKLCVNDQRFSRMVKPGEVFVYNYWRIREGDKDTWTMLDDEDHQISHQLLSTIPHEAAWNATGILNSSPPKPRVRRSSAWKYGCRRYSCFKCKTQGTRTSFYHFSGKAYYSIFLCTRCGHQFKYDEVPLDNSE